jgi:hypothetical protein
MRHPSADSVIGIADLDLDQCLPCATAHSYKGGMEQQMPVSRYFFFVGGVLLALMLILDASFPALPVAEKANGNLPVIRIHSDHKWPERIVYDTSLPTIVPASIASTQVIVHAPEGIADAARVREAFAMLPPSADQHTASAKMPELKPRHYRKIARKRAPAPRFAMARQQLGWFGW